MCLFLFSASWGGFQKCLSSCLCSVEDWEVVFLWKLSSFLNLESFALKNLQTQNYRLKQHRAYPKMCNYHITIIQNIKAINQLKPL